MVVISGWGGTERKKETDQQTERDEEKGKRGREIEGMGGRKTVLHLQSSVPKPVAERAREKKVDKTKYGSA